MNAYCTCSTVSPSHLELSHITPSSLQIDHCSTYSNSRVIKANGSQLAHVVHTIASELRIYYHLSYLRLHFGRSFKPSSTAILFQQRVLSDIYVQKSLDLYIDHYDSVITFALLASTQSANNSESHQYIIRLPPLWRDTIAKQINSQPSQKAQSSSPGCSDPTKRARLQPLSASTRFLGGDIYDSHKPDTMILFRVRPSMQFEAYVLSGHEKAGFQPILSAKACLVSKE